MLFAALPKPHGGNANLEAWTPKVKILDLEYYLGNLQIV
jgi:hypothetical protein